MRKGGNIQRVQEVPKFKTIVKQKQNNRKQRQKAAKNILLAKHPTSPLVCISYYFHLLATLFEFFCYDFQFLPGLASKHYAPFRRLLCMHLISLMDMNIFRFFISIIDVVRRYTGSRIEDETITLDFVKKMMDDFKNPKCLHRRY